jgi:hypothetical protein
MTAMPRERRASRMRKRVSSWDDRRVPLNRVALRKKVEIVMRLMDAVNRRDVDTFTEVTTDFEWLPVFAARVEGDVYQDARASGPAGS